MIQNIIIVVVLIGCVWFIGRRMYNNLRGSQKGCGCSCSGCGPDEVSDCHFTAENPDKK